MSITINSFVLFWKYNFQIIFKMLIIKIDSIDYEHYN